ncbi:MAG: hypothetical protein ACYDA6_09655 [Solirubrobacteraceae bacterium]
MSASSLTYTGELVVVTCWCGMRHAVPAELRDYQLRQHRDGLAQTDIYCPLGHSYIISGKGEAEKLREQLEQEQRRLQAARDRAARIGAARDQAEASARAYKGAATRARTRAAAAVCPCCKRSFVQLRRHLATKHPDYDPATP